jgi:nucleotide-binding universal stress UspA family protein
MYERILVPLDGSKVGEAALPEVESLVVKLAPDTQVEVTLLQVISDMTYDFLTDDEAAQLPYEQGDLQKIEQAARNYLEKVAVRFGEKGIQVKIMVTEGHAAEEIVKAAKTINADLIAMASHGRSGLRRWALGSITDKVLHESPVSVLTVRSIEGTKR